MKRNDGRGYDDLRKIKITRNYMKYAEGSCLIEFGNTKVICTASVEDKVPIFLKDKGSGWVTAEYGMLPRSCIERIPRDASRGKIGGRTYEIQRLIGRSLRTIVELKSVGERTIWVDCDVIQGDGGTRCASITGSFIALTDCFLKLKKEKSIEKLPIKDFVAAISVGILGEQIVLDLTYEEDSRADVDMNVVMTGDGRFIEIQGTAERKPFSKNQMNELLAVAKKGIDELIVLQREELNLEFDRK